MDASKKIVATGILVFDFELLIGDLFTSILYVSVPLSTKAAETEIRTVYRANASKAKSKKPLELPGPVLARNKGRATGYLLDRRWSSSFSASAFSHRLASFSKYRHSPPCQTHLKHLPTDPVSHKQGLQ